MDDQLALRIQLFREGGQVGPKWPTSSPPSWPPSKPTGTTVTEDSAGMLTSHLMMALTRLLDGETDRAVPHRGGRSPPNWRASPGAVARARAISARAEQRARRDAPRLGDQFPRHAPGRAGPRSPAAPAS